MILLRCILILCYSYTCLTAEYDIVWDQNFFADLSRYPNTYKLPHNSLCSFCIDDVITLRINSTYNIYENLYRVPSETAMMNCNATGSINDNVYAFSNKLEITIRSGGSEPALSFLFRAEPYYFISTSNGTQTSAENDVIRSPNSCLQLAFTVRLNSDADCGTYAANCNFTTVFTHPPSSLRCTNVTCITQPSNSSITTPIIPTELIPLQINFRYISCVGYIIWDTSSTSTMFPGECTIIWLFWILLILNVLVCCTIICCFLFGVITLPLYWFDLIPIKGLSGYNVSCKVSPIKQSKDEKKCPSYQESANTYKMDSPKVDHPSTKRDN